MANTLETRSLCIKTSIGHLTICGTAKEIHSILRTKSRSHQTPYALLQKCAKEIQDYLKGQRKTFSIPIAFPEGTFFQQKVWKALYKIPFGKNNNLWRVG